MRAPSLAPSPSNKITKSTNTDDGWIASCLTCRCCTNVGAFRMLSWYALLTNSSVQMSLLVRCLLFLHTAALISLAVANAEGAGGQASILVLCLPAFTLGFLGVLFVPTLEKERRDILKDVRDQLFTPRCCSSPQCCSDALPATFIPYSLLYVAYPVLHTLYCNSHLVRRLNLLYEDLTVVLKTKEEEVRDWSSYFDEAPPHQGHRASTHLGLVPPQPRLSQVDIADAEFRDQVAELSTQISGAVRDSTGLGQAQGSEGTEQGLYGQGQTHHVHCSFGGMNASVYCVECSALRPTCSSRTPHYPVRRSNCTLP